MKVGKSLVTLFSVFIVWLVYQITLPTLHIGHFDGFIFIASAVLVIIGNIVLWSHSDIDKAAARFGSVIAIEFVIVVVIVIIGTFAGSSWFNAYKLHSQLGKVEVVEYDDMIKQIDNSQIPIVDDELAQKQADKKIGEDVALGSRASLGDAKIQEVNGEIMYVAPLEHSGFFKWKRHQSTPGYITVSATNQNKVEYVTKIGDDAINIVYAKSAYFNKDLTRHIRSEGYRTVGLTEYTFEINDEGKPFWVVTTYRNTTFWGNPEATGVVVVDAQTGKTEWYSLEEIPEWVDIVQPYDFIENQIDNWGKLVKGAFNFSGEDKIQKTSRMLTVYSNNDCYYFTGMTSVGSDQSCVGFIMVNTRNKKAQICYMSGATENAAMRSAEGIVSDFGYSSTEPLPLNVNGIPTYVMALKDDEGLVKAYAMVNINLYSIVAKGSTLAETSRNYMQKVATSGQNHVISSEEAYSYTLEGVVARISSVVQDGTTYFYILIENENEKIFTSSHITSDELALTRDGDTVVIKYIDDKNGTVDIISFDNTAYGVTISEEQQNRNELDEGSSALDAEFNQIIEVDPDMTEEKWNSLTDEEKAKLLQQLFGNE